MAMKYHFFKHLATINRHRFLVFKNCLYSGIPRRGLVHDLSKYSGAEFWPSAKYFKGNESPVFTQRLNEGMYSTIVQHHIHRNAHHFEFWINEFKGDLIVIKMPYKYAVEYVCDTIGASQTYLRINSTLDAPLDYFNKRSGFYLMHPMIKEFVKAVLTNYKEKGLKGLSKKFTKPLYYSLNKKYEDTYLVPLYSTNKEIKYVSLKDKTKIEKY
jgi:hypothetical protein